MVRRYDPGRRVPPDVVDRIVDNGLRAPSAGFSQGWAFLVLDTAEDIALFRAAARTPEQPERWFAANVHAPLLLGSHADRSRHVPPLLERLRDVAMSRAWIGIAGSPGGS